ncbi:MAG: ABC transporter ATP-binding protein [Kiritimatiellae bacterium]|jgi:ABC-type lipoprotein export system ATPase subunit|nr:ABC transporter ATP-binding protein [Kiritimatiellia bacterium]
MILELKNICKSYTTESEEIVVLNDFYLAVNAGDTLAVVGASGSGKTTLLNVISGVDKANRGQIILNGQDFSLYTLEQLAEVRLQNIGIVFQNHHLLPQCTAFENALLPTLPLNSDVNANEQYADELFEKLGMADRKHHFPSQLSGGECQRVAIIRALINKPKLLLADEPTGNLDKSTKMELLNTLRYINEEFHMTIIMATHSDTAASYMSRTIPL